MTLYRFKLKVTSRNAINLADFGDKLTQINNFKKGMFLNSCNSINFSCF
jgi:hypothetical protein